MAEFFLNWMIELNLIFIPFYFIFKLSEIEISNLESPAHNFWSDPVNKYSFFIFSWFIKKDPLSFFVLFKIVPLLTVTLDLVQLWIHFMHVFHNTNNIEAHLLWIFKLLCKL